MPIRVTATLLRPGGVYLAGEVVECEVSFANIKPTGVPGENPNAKSPKTSASDDVAAWKSETLAWASCQIHCQQILNELRVKMLPRSASLSQSDVPGGGQTSLLPNKGEHGHSVFSTKPVILFCDLVLKPNEVKKFMFKDVLPADGLPPSFRGQAVKFIYKLTVATQRVGSSIKLLRVPIRILVLEGLSNVCLDDLETSSSSSFANPFLHSVPHNANMAGSNSADGLHRAVKTMSIASMSSAKQTVAELGNEIIEAITSARSSSNFNVVLDKGKIATFTLFKNSFKLGDNVLGQFDFSNGDIKCVQYCVTLQQEEELAEELRPRVKHHKFVSSHSKAYAFCVDYQHSQISVPIPLNVTHTFKTDIVSTAWKLHFEFVLSEDKTTAPSKLSDGALVWNAPATINIKTLVWDLPIQIYPCNPLFACLCSSSSAFPSAETQLTKVLII